MEAANNGRGIRPSLIPISDRFSRNPADLLRTQRRSPLDVALPRIRSGSLHCEKISRWLVG